MDYEVQRSTRRCAITNRELREGETFYSVLITDASGVRRIDYSRESWPGPPPESLAWWKSQVPIAAARKAEMAPNDVLLEFFQQIQSVPQQQDTQYVLALLLVRRRVLRIEQRETLADGASCLVLYCPRDESEYRLPELPPSAERISEIEQQLAQLLYAKAS